MKPLSLMKESDENKSNKSFENSGAFNHGPVKIEPALKVFKTMLDIPRNYSLTAAFDW